jgi:hypothetical protein
VRRVRLETQDQLARRVRLEIRVRQDQLVRRVRLETREIQDQLEQRGTKETRAFKVQQVQLEIQDRLDPQEHKEHQANREQPQVVFCISIRQGGPIQEPPLRER